MDVTSHGYTVQMVLLVGMRHSPCLSFLLTLPESYLVFLTIDVYVVQVSVIRTLADEASLHLLPPMVLCPSSPMLYLSTAPLPGAILGTWAQLLGDGALDRSLESGSVAGELALFHLSRYFFAEDADTGAPDEVQ